MKRKSVLFYCQHLLGVGHISRSLTFCRALLDDFDVTFVQGGPDIGRTIDAPGFTHLFLPPLLMREHDSSLYDPNGEASVETLWARRGAALAPVMKAPFDAVVVELFPFGRNKFKPEILGLIAEARRVNPAAKVYCSNRDIMVQRPDQAYREQKIVRVLNEHFDYVLAHTDPKLFPMEATFAAASEIADKILYTGYVAETGRGGPKARRNDLILVSLGGGAVGEELARAAAATAERFPHHEMRILTGPYTTDVLRGDLNAIAEKTPNLTIAGFSSDFRAELASSSVSVSLAGYNTTMDILSTKTPALVYPYLANHEQNMRARALEDLGLLKLLYEDDLVPDRLEKAIRGRLSAPAPRVEIDLSGAATSTRIIAGHLG